jgi:hypothetical protein
VLQNEIGQAAHSLKRTLPEELGNISIDHIRKKTYRIMHRNGFANRRVSNQQNQLDELQLGTSKVDFKISISWKPTITTDPYIE